MGWQVVYVPFLFAGNTIINQNGIFVYNGTPAFGNLKVSIAGQSGVDDFGNPYVDNVDAYNVAVPGGGYAQIAANPVTGMPFLVLIPPAATQINGPPQIDAGVSNAGLANEFTQINVVSGAETGQPTGAATLQLIGRANDNSSFSFVNLIADLIEATLPDGNNYQASGALTQFLAANFTVNTTAAQQITGMLFNVSARTYRITGFIRSLAAAAGVAQPMTFSFHGTAVTSAMSIATDAVVEQGNTTTNPSVITALASPPGVITGNVPNNTLVQHKFDGYVTFSAAGTFGLFANQVTSVADETFTLQPGNRTWWRLEPQ